MLGEGGSLLWRSRRSCELLRKTTSSLLRLRCLPQRFPSFIRLFILQVSGSYGLPPTPARHALFVVYQTAVPYLAERISSRVAAHEIILADSQSDELYGNASYGRHQHESYTSFESSSSSAHSRLQQRLYRLWLSAVQKWPTVCMYYHISKRAAGIRYVFLGKPLNQRPSYTFLRHTERGLPVLNEEGNLITLDSSYDKGSWASGSAGNPEIHTSLFLSSELFLKQQVTCIMEWCSEKPECPLYRTPITHSSLLCIYHSDF
ncbi:hypothetical protein GIB67_041550 [Kingdonia uniflora]|uniref:RING-type E3 ubiquitin transferase n=1 Tax=Kingdonia uniflora TaxID=39325 RepID=A0A7J7MQ84_9MAGN|nr:hypothetical protein GIB67_041550 [Kingdonia uniflora]